MRRRYSRSELVATLLLGLALGTQLTHCDPYTPHDTKHQP